MSIPENNESVYELMISLWMKLGQFPKFWKEIEYSNWYTWGDFKSPDQEKHEFETFQKKIFVWNLGFNFNLIDYKK